MRAKALALVLLAGLTLGPAPARAGSGDPDRSVPVLFVHGLEPFGFGYSCTVYWQPMRDAFQGYGWSNALTDLKYYAEDTDCADDLDHDGSHNRHLGHDNPFKLNYNHSWLDTSSHGSETPIEHLGYHLAWFVYDHYSRFGQTVDLVGHSMGGLIIRYALTMEERHDADFPPVLYVSQAVTLETPHGGADLSVLCGLARQCLEMVPGSAFLGKLGSNPQGTGGTEWTVIGSAFDPLVPSASATAMRAAHRIVYLWPPYDHVAVLWDASDATDAVWNRSDDGSAWVTESGQLHSIRETDAAAANPGQ